MKNRFCAECTLENTEILEKALNHLSFIDSEWMQVVVIISDRNEKDLFTDIHRNMANQIAKVMGTIWGPSGADRTQVGPMMAP